MIYYYDDGGADDDVKEQMKKRKWRSELLRRSPWVFDGEMIIMVMMVVVASPESVFVWLEVCRVAMYLFPAIFFMFNLLYWTYYLIVVNMLDLSLF